MYSFRTFFRGTQAFMPGDQDPSMEQQYTAQFYQPAVPSGNAENTGIDYLEEEPPLLEGKTTYMSSSVYSE